MPLGLPRTPPSDIRKKLRAEVGFGCPIPRCRSPFLEYHHFDPEWHIENHHRPEGIIPLCPTHHSQASAFTIEQLRAFKRAAYGRPASGRFEWLRRELVGAVGGCLFHETSPLIALRGEPSIWFDRDEDGYALLNVRMLTTLGHEHERISIRDNDFVVRGLPVDFETPPSGHMLRVRYDNGDYMRVEFKEFRDSASAAKSFPHIPSPYIGALDVRWPLLFVLVSMRVGGTKISLGPTVSKLPMQAMVRGVVASHNKYGINIG